MNSFSSASQMCDPFPRTINGGSPPTDPNARTGEFTPPGIMLSARCCSRRDCSTFRDVMDGIHSPRGTRMSQMTARNRLLYQRRDAQINQIFILPPSLCNIAEVISGHHVALLTGRVQ